MKTINKVLLTIKDTVFNLTKDKVFWLDTKKIKMDSELEAIFVQKESEIQNISESMLKDGYDIAHPIILSQSKNHPELNNIIADGMTRYKSAIRAGLAKVAVIYKEYEDREQLIKFVYNSQLLRRNLKEAEVYKAWETLNSLCNSEGKKIKTDSEIAQELNISRRQISKYKEVAKKSSQELKEAIKSGKITVNTAYKEIKRKEQNDKVKDSKQKTKYSDDYVGGYIDGMMTSVLSIEDGIAVSKLQEKLVQLMSESKSIEMISEDLAELKIEIAKKQ